MNIHGVFGLCRKELARTYLIVFTGGEWLFILYRMKLFLTIKTSCYHAMVKVTFSKQFMMSPVANVNILYVMSPRASV